MRDPLVQKEGPLDVVELNMLEETLDMLKSDVEIFGPTGEDEQRIAAIEARLEKEKER